MRADSIMVALRALACDVVRSVSMLEGGRLRIEVDDRAARARQPLQRAAPGPTAPTEPAAAEEGLVPALSIAVLIVGSRGDV